MRHAPEGSDIAPAEAPLRVIVADDDPLARRVVRDALESGGIIVIAEASTGREAVELSLYYKPDIVLMDLVMPDGDGIQATRRILAREPSVEVVILTSSDDDDIGIVGLRAGASGFLNKRAGVAALPRALRGAPPRRRGGGGGGGPAPPDHAPRRRDAPRARRRRRAAPGSQPADAA